MNLEPYKAGDRIRATVDISYTDFSRGEGDGNLRSCFVVYAPSGSRGTVVKTPYPAGPGPVGQGQAVTVNFDGHDSTLAGVTVFVSELRHLNVLEQLSEIE